MSDVAAIILAAGRGTRFGTPPKLLAPLEGKPLVRHVAEAALASCATPVLVVLGHAGAEVARVLAGLSLRFVDNPAYRDGLSSSLKAGFGQIGPAEGALVLLGDMPRVTAERIDGLINAWRRHDRPAALVPTYRGRRGNPVLLSRHLAAEIARLSGDQGAGPLLRSRTDVVECALDDPAILSDVDTPAELRRLCGEGRIEPE